MTEFLIDCGTCIMRGTETCDDCVVTAVLDREDGALIFNAAEERAVRTLARAGLLPLVRFKKASGDP
ncbi:MAG: hypothetical protein ACYDCC_02880 [Actinomycetota bacterium]